MVWRIAVLVALVGLYGTAPARAEGDDAAALYARLCAECHGPGRLGGMGPALLPENLGRLKRAEAAEVIAQGRPSTQMPAFAQTLPRDRIDALAALIYTPLAAVPPWGMTEIQASHVVSAKPEDLPAKPVFDADPLNLFTVVEAGDHHVTILDGDRFEPLARFPSRFALHGGAKYSPDGRFVFLMSRDGWVGKYDLYSFRLVAEVRAGLNSRNIAVSGDGKWVMVGNFLPHTLVVLNAADLSPARVIAVADAKGRSSRVSAVYTAPPRRSFVVALKDVKEVWELSYDPDAEPVYAGLVHNYEPGQTEAVGAEKQPFARRRIATEDYMDDFFFNQGYTELIGASRDGKGAVYNLVVGRKIADLDLPGMPHLGSGITWVRDGVPILATPNLKGAVVSVIDMTNWQTIRKIETLGPGFFMRSHDNSPYAWVDVFLGSERDAVHVIDKQTLEIVRTLRPAPGKTAAHVEFTRDGRHALLSIWDNDGAIVVYDAATLEEVKRIPFKKPVGKYNVYNKISYGQGTSH